MALCVLRPLRVAQAATRSILYVANSQGDDITVIDLATQKIITTFKVGPIVHGVCAQADGRRAFATIESEHALKVIDTRTNTVTDTIALGGQPNECAATSDGHYVVVPLLAPANSAVIVDMSAKKIVKTLPIHHPHNCFTPEGGSNTVVYCEERDNSFIRRIDLTKMDGDQRCQGGGRSAPLHRHRGREDALYRAEWTARLRRGRHSRQDHVAGGAATHAVDELQGRTAQHAGAWHRPDGGRPEAVDHLGGGQRPLCL